METLQDRAKKIKDTRENEKRLKDEKELAEYETIRKKLLEEFELGFKEELDMLHKEGIKYSAHLQNYRYPFMGAYIEFKKGKNSVKMDFNSRNNYRYEFVKYSHNYDNPQKMVYGEWDKEDFIIYLQENLYKPEPEEPVGVITADDLRKEWEKETENSVTNSQEEINIEYVCWLENRLLEHKNSFM